MKILSFEGDDPIFGGEDPESDEDTEEGESSDGDY